MPGIIDYLKRSSYFDKNVEVFIEKIRKESLSFKESYAKSLKDAIEHYSVEKRPKVTQKEIYFALRIFFDRCIQKDFTPTFPTIEEIESGIN